MGIDWNYFITLSPSNSVKIEHRDLLLSTYYSTLVQALSNHNYTKIPTFKNVQDEVTNYEFYGNFYLRRMKIRFNKPIQLI